MTAPTRRRQRGSVLIVAMVFLLLLAGLAANAMRSSLTSVQAIGNMQWRNEGIAAANDAIDRVLSSTDFATKASTVAEQVYQVDIDGDGSSDIRVEFPVATVAGVAKAGPRCLRQRTVPAASLDPELPTDRGCFGSAAGEASGLGLEEAGGGAAALDTNTSICADTQWVLPVRATDAVSRTTVDVSQGASVRVFRSDALNYCN